MWVSPVFDRTSANVALVKSLDARINENGWNSLSNNEKVEYLNSLKGALNYLDLNRIEGNSKYLADTLRELGYGPNTDKHKTDWDEDLYLYPKDLERIRLSVKKLIDTYYSTMEVPNSLYKPHFEKQNTIEKIHQEIYDTIDLMLESFRYVGTYHLGQDFNF